MKFKDRFLEQYLNEAPVSLAYERAFECHILSKQEFQRPVLDLGCGDGIFANIVFDEKIDTGIDPLQHELGSAKKYNIYEELICAFGNQIPKPDNYYKTIFSNSVLEHIQDIDPVLKEVHRLLMKGGRFYVTIPTNYFDKYSVLSRLLNGLGLKSLSQKYSRFYNNFWKHFHYYDRQGWKEKFEKNDFKVIDIIEYGAPGACFFNDFMVPFALPNFLIKKVTNKWFLFKPLRQAYSPLWARVLKPRVKINPELKKGGLIFFSLTKE